MKTPALKPRKQPSQQRSRAMVDAILDAAARVLVKRGYSGTTTNAVAEAAGISIGSLYQYFPNKESLAAALHARHGQEMRSIFERVLGDPAPRTLEQTLRGLVGAAVAAHRLSPQLHVVLEQEVPHLDRFEDGLTETKRRLFERLLEAHHREMAVRDVALATHVAGEMIHALVHAAVIDPPPGLAPAALEAETVRALHAYLTAGRRARTSAAR